MVEAYHLIFPDGQVKKTSGGKTGTIIRMLLENYPATVAREVLAEAIGGESRTTVNKLVGQLNFTAGRLPRGWRIKLIEEGKGRFYSMNEEEIKEGVEVPAESADGNDNSLSQFATILSQVKDSHLEGLCNQIDGRLFPFETMSSQKLIVDIAGIDVRLATSITCIALIEIGKSIKREMGCDSGNGFGDLTYGEFLDTITLVHGQFNPPEIEDLAGLYTPQLR